ncbi:hypothetical protein GA0061105_1134 [Rhizobium aethiopicum]|uniref:Uncharacterized protein n=1 Tax=Rhizobium aethiopicum TaxID=1138170 RepID=A0A1C3Y8M7_9HYPH|nr:hypothetical protein GA0061105_1134 [Rhizobium aethiopicum]
MLNPCCGHTEIFATIRSAVNPQPDTGTEYSRSAVPGTVKDVTVNTNMIKN